MPPKSAAERMREYRSRMSEERKKEANKENAFQQKMARAKWSKRRIAAEKRKSAERMRKSRDRKQNIIATSTESPRKSFRSIQSYGKAMSKVRKALPQSPNKKMAVVKKLATQYGLFTPERATPASGICPDTLQAVDSFYNSDMISRQLPGRKDFVTIHNKDGSKERHQKKVLLVTVMEAYQLFKKDHPDLKIGKSTFATLRPKHVVPITDRDQTVCCCKYHENVELILTAIRKTTNGNLPPTANSLVQQSSCDWKKSCLMGECQNCEDLRSFLLNIVGNDLSIPISFYQWNNLTKKVQVTLTLDETVNELTKQLKFLRPHSFIAKLQLSEIKHLKLNLSEGEAVIQEDFSENFSMKQQGEIMSAHWLSEGVTLFTLIIYRESGFRSYVIISDELRHDKYAVLCFNKKVLEHAVEVDGPITNLHMFTDGAGSQFKNRFTISTMLQPHYLHEDLKRMDWSFFATSHGKGPVDGLGGTVKRAVWHRILQGKVVLNSAEEFFKEAKSACPNITILLVSKAEVEKERNIMEPYWEMHPPQPIPQTHKLHFVRPIAGNKACVEVSSFSPFLDSPFPTFEQVKLINFVGDELLDVTVEPNKPTCTQKGAYVIVKYESDTKEKADFYPGIVEDIQKDDYLVRVLHKKGKGWFWPEPKDEIWYCSSNVLRVIDPPNPMNSRGLFLFPNIEL